MQQQGEASDGAAGQAVQQEEALAVPQEEELVPESVTEPIGVLDAADEVAMRASSETVQTRVD